MKQPSSQLPDEQTRPLPQLLPLLMGVQAVVEVVGWQVWHELVGVMVWPLVRTVPPMKQPVVQVPDEQIWPAPQPVPMPVTGLHAVVETPGWQLWHGVAGFAVPLARNVPPMKQPAVQVPDEQIWPDPQLVPVMGLHAVVETAGWQLSQVFGVLVWLVVRRVPPMKQPGVQVPDEQICPDAQPAPLPVTGLHALVETAGWQLWQGLVGLVVPTGRNVPPMKQPVVQTPAEQVRPEPQLLPVSGLQAVVERAGWQLSHGLVGFVVPPSRTTPAMKQPPVQVPEEQTRPDPQLVPVRGLNAVVEMAGWQLRHGLVGFAAPPSKTPPSMKQPVVQAPDEQTCPDPQLVPVMGLHPVVEVAG